MLALLGLPLAVGIGITAPALIRLAAPSGFDPAIPALQILAPSVVLLFVNNAFVYTLTAMNRQLDFTRLCLVTLVVNLVLNLALIPPYGYLGAAAGSTLTELALFVGGWWLLRRQGLALVLLRTVARAIVAALVMGSVVYSFRFLPIAAVAVVGVVTYGIGLVALRVLNSEEWSIVRSGLMTR
jgi:O-antigen/teichoic acid export membrane protein